MNASHNILCRWLAGIAAGLSLGLGLGNAHAVDMIITSEIPLSVNPSPYIVQFMDDVKKRTNGTLAGKYFDSSQLYNDRDAIAALGTGSVHMVLPVTSRLEALDARIGMASLPFALSSTEMGNKCFADGFTKMTSGFVEGRGIKILGYLRTADLMFLMKNRDVQKLEDLRGAKIRVIAGKTMLDAIRAVKCDARGDCRIRDVRGLVAGRDRRHGHIARRLGQRGRHHREVRDAVPRHVARDLRRHRGQEVVGRTERARAHGHPAVAGRDHRAPVDRDRQGRR